MTDIFPLEGVSEAELLSFAYALECKSEHPLARAIVEKAKEEKVFAKKVEDFKILPGNGLMAKVAGEELYGGNLTFVKNRWMLKFIDYFSER